MCFFYKIFDLISLMDDFDQTYNERYQAFQKGAKTGKIAAEQDALQDVIDDSRQFAQ